MEKKYEDITFNSVSVCSIRDQEEGWIFLDLLLFGLVGSWLFKEW